MKTTALPRRIAFTLMGLLLLSGMSMAGGGATAGTVEVILQNKCTRDVKYATKTADRNAAGVVGKGEKLKVSLTVGTELTVDGEAFMTVTATDAGQTFQVCR